MFIGLPYLKNVWRREIPNLNEKVLAAVGMKARRDTGEWGIAWAKDK
jgi:hypothetical protein